MKRKLLLAEKASADLSDIYLYTLKAFGQNQADRYHAMLIELLLTIQGTPSLGHSRRDIPERCLAFIVGQHIVIYRIDNSTVFVLRVLHSRMDFTLRI